MRKVSSAPSLVETGKRGSLEGHVGPRLGSKSSSSGSLPRLVGTHSKEDSKQGSAPSRVQTQALYYAHDHPQLPPTDQVLSEEFAESARGLAGVDCFELYGGSKEAPALRTHGFDKSSSDPEVQQATEEDSNAYALATCLNTPYTGEEKNLGELVNTQAKLQLNAAITRLVNRYEKEVSAELKEQVAARKQYEAEPRAMPRRRRLSNWISLGKSRKENEIPVDINHAEISQLLMTSLEEDNNRIEIPNEWRNARCHAFPGLKTISEDRALDRVPTNRHTEMETTSY